MRRRKGPPRFTEPSADIKANDLRRWARCHLEKALWPLPRTACISFSKLEGNESGGRFLIAARSDGKDVFDAAFVVFAIVRATRSRIDEEQRSELLKRSGLDASVWREALASATARLGVDPNVIERLTHSLARSRHAAA